MLVGGPTVDGYPAVSLDGTRVSFVRETSVGQMLYVVDTAGGDPRPLTKEPLQEIDDAAWSPGGDDRVHRTRRRDSNLWVARPTGARPTKSNLVRICRSSCRSGARQTVTSCCWSGRQQPSLGFLPEYRLSRSSSVPSRNRAGEGIGLYVVRPDGSGLRPITPTDGTDYDHGLVTWTPAGNRILTQTMDPGTGYLKIRVLGADGELIRTIEPTSGVQTVSPIVSPDGQRVAYADMTSDENWVIRVEPIDGSSEPVETGASFLGIAAGFRWSPDGNNLMVTHHYFRQTWLFDADGGPGTLMTWTDPGSLTWQRMAP